MKNGQHWRKQKPGRVEAKVLAQQAQPHAPKLVKCDACHQAEGIFHVTINVEVFSVKSTRMKQAQFWLCELCEAKSKIFLTRDERQPARVAQALTPTPWYWIDAGDDARGMQKSNHG